MAFNLGSLIFKASIDDKELQVGAAGASKSLDNFAKKADQTGRKLTRTLTLPIAAVAAAAVKLAADFEVSARKFATAFSDSTDAAADAVENLNEQFGIAESTATTALAFTGDLLKGFGASSDEALNLANSTAELSAALSAYSGEDFVDVNNAITKALLGETESLKLLGVAIRQSDIDARIAAEGKENLTGQARLLARAQATLQIAYEQSGDAVASFANNTDTLSFQSQVLLGDLKDLGIEFGTILIPIIKDVVSAIGDAVEWFSQLDESQKKTILTIAGLTAGVGPAITAIGKLSAAISFLAANPIVLALAGVAALAAGIRALVVATKNWAEEQREAAARAAQAWKDSQIEALQAAVNINELETSVLGLSQAMLDAANDTEQFTFAQEEAARAQRLKLRLEDLERQMELVGENSVKLGIALKELQEPLNEDATEWWQGNATEAERFRTAVDFLLNDYGKLDSAITAGTTTLEQQAIWTAISTENTEGLIEALSNLGGANNDLVAVREELAEIQSGDTIRAYAEELRLAEETANAEERQLAATQAQIDAEIERTQNIVKARTEALQEYNDALDESQRAFNLGLINEQELLDERISSARSYADALLELGYSGELTERSWRDAEGNIVSAIQQGDIALDQISETIAQLEAQRQAAEDAAEAERKARAEAQNKRDQKLADAEEVRQLEESATRLLREQTLERLELIEIERDERLNVYREAGASTVEIEKYYNNLISEERRRLRDEALAIAQEKKDAEEERLAAEAAAEEAASQARLDALREEWEAQRQANQERLELEQSLLNDIADISDNRIYLLRQNYLEELEQAEQAGLDTYLVEEKYALLEAQLLEQLHQEQLDRIAEEKQARIDALLETFSAVSSYASQVFSIFDNLYQTRINNIDAETQAQIEALDQQELGEEAYQEQVEAIQKEAALKKYDIELKQFQTRKAANIAQVIMDTAAAIVRGYAELGPIGGSIAAAILAAVGATQIGAISSEPPPPRPALAEGGLITSRPGGVPVTVGEGRDDELVLPLNDSVFDRLADGLSEAGTIPPQEDDDNMNLTIIIEGLGDVQLNLTQQALNNRKIRVPASSIVRT